MFFKIGNCLFIFILLNLIVSLIEYFFDFDGVWIFGGEGSKVCIS